jgi:hypothetical protein
VKIADTYLDNFFHSSTCEAILAPLRNLNHSAGEIFPRLPNATSFGGDLRLGSWRADESAEPVSITVGCTNRIKRLSVGINDWILTKDLSTNK